MQVNYLEHHGVKGMKWGQHKYYNKDGSLSEKGIKKYATKGYAKDQMNNSKTLVGKAFNMYSGGHKTAAKIQYGLSSKKENKARAESYLNNKNHGTNKKNTQIISDRRKEIIKGQAKLTIGTAKTMGGMFVVFGGAHLANKISKVGAQKVKDYVKSQAYQRGMQKANAGLARIGQYTYEHVAGNVYREVMK